MIYVLPAKQLMSGNSTQDIRPRFAGKIFPELPPYFLRASSRPFAPAFKDGVFIKVTVRAVNFKTASFIFKNHFPF